MSNLAAGIYRKGFQPVNIGVRLRQMSHKLKPLAQMSIEPR